MKLDKNTKHNLKVGDVLQFSDSEEYEVLHIFCDYKVNRNAMSLTLKCKDGRIIYCTPSSNFYGAEIIFSYSHNLCVLQEEVSALLKDFEQNGYYDPDTYGDDMHKMLKKVNEVLSINSQLMRASW